MRNRKLPNLAHYVSTMAKRQTGASSTGAGCAISLLGSGVAWVMLDRIFPLWVAGLVTVLVILPTLTILSSIWVAALGKPRDEDDVRKRQSREAILFMNGALQQGKLHRRIDKACGVLLEECARHWSRVQDALSGPFWEDKGLPLHWKQIRDSSRAAADRAMEDLLVMLTPVLEPRQTQSGAQEFLGDILEAVFNVSTDAPAEPLPKAYQPAREIAQKLMALADEVEAAAQSARRDPAFAEHFASNTQIDEVLSNLREIRQAESELHQHIGRPTEE